jgi:hypothetical protein
MDVPSYKGTGFKSCLNALRKLRGAATVESTMAQLPTEIADAIRYQRIVASGWYPVEWLRALHAGAQAATKEGASLARAIGAEAMRIDLSGIYRVLLIVVSPQAIVSKSARAFKLFYTHGEMNVLEATRGRAHAEWKGCKGFDANVWNDTLGSCEAALELCGAKNLRIRLVSGGRDGDERAEVVASWT